MVVAPAEIERLQSMDQEAWAALQDSYYRRIYFFIKRYVDNHQTAEDLTQDVFLGAVKGISRFDLEYTLEQFLFGIAKNRIVDHFRKHKMPLIPAKGDSETEKSTIWLENMEESKVMDPGAGAVQEENARRKRQILGKILRDYVAQLWEAGEMKKLMILEYLFVLGGRNKDAASRFGVEDEKAIAGIKFRAIEKLRGLARQRDPNHSLFGGLWRPGTR